MVAQADSGEDLARVPYSLAGILGSHKYLYGNTFASVASGLGYRRIESSLDVSEVDELAPRRILYQPIVLHPGMGELTCKSCNI
jgi:hypothetical protein